MTEPTRDELMRRIEQLERANRRWRRRSFVVAGMLALGLVVLVAENYRRIMNAMQEAELMAENYRRVMNAMQEAELARQQAEQARQKAEAARKEAERALPNLDEIKKRHEALMRRLESRPKTADDIPLNLNDVLWPRPFPKQHSEPPHHRISPLERP